MKIVAILPYIKINRVYKMGVIEIHPLEASGFQDELTPLELQNLKKFTSSFHQGLFHEGTIPPSTEGVGVLKYNGTILRTKDNGKNLQEVLHLFYLLLKLHTSYDPYNGHINYLDPDMFQIFEFKIDGINCYKYNNFGEIKNLHSSNIITGGLQDYCFLPIELTLEYLDPLFQIAANNSMEEFWKDGVIDMSNLYTEICKNEKLLIKFRKISHLYFGINKQDSAWFYLSLIPGIFEILSDEDGKKKVSETYGEKMDSLFISENDIQNVVVRDKNNNISKVPMGFIRRVIWNIFDVRNDFLHAGKFEIENLNTNFKGENLPILDAFQLIFHFSLLQNLKEAGIINQSFNLSMDSKLSTLYGRVRGESEHKKH